ncbi:hypothetical protein SAMN06265371_106235 [Lutibacter agarilyticus]|uniref:Uncharacterized protein n=2 Tax=Lutibacter agarilyticus TaxID=1109740 RepID=A0A238XRG3_9FLAO|nr:hypothetical protein SAMN06265371_106235 [Lutibacter agarilyticus]
MKTILTTLFLLINLISYSQNFTEEYLKKSTNLSDEIPSYIKDVIKNENLAKIEIYKTILEKNDLNIDKLESFMIIDEKSQDPSNYSHAGIIIVGKKHYSFLFEKDNYNITNEFLENYSTIDKSNARSIIFSYLSNKEFDKLLALAKNENSYFEKSISPKMEYEISVYNQGSEKRLKMLFLHDFITEIIE